MMSDLALVELVPPDDDGPKGKRALAEPRDHSDAPKWFNAQKGYGFIQVLHKELWKATNAIGWK